MTAGHYGKITRRDWEDVIDRRIDDALSEHFTHLPGKIVSFDPVKQQATVEVQYKPRHNGQPVDMPDLTEVPVVMPRGGTSYGLTFPIAAGDGVMLKFQSRNMETSYGEGTKAEGPTLRAGDLSDSAAIVGYEPSPKAFADYDAVNMHLRGPVGGFKLSPEGKMSFKGADDEEMVTILFDLIDTLLQSIDVEGPGFDPATRAALADLKSRTTKIKLEA